jgi:hypothetical protein
MAAVDGAGRAVTLTSVNSVLVNRAPQMSAKVITPATGVARLQEKVVYVTVEPDSIDGGTF